MFQEHIDKVLEFKTPVWLGDNICVTNGTIEEHEQDLRDVLFELQEADYRAREKKNGTIQKRTNLAAYHKPERSKANQT